jgi:hypothetical protein
VRVRWREITVSEFAKGGRPDDLASFSRAHELQAPATLVIRYTIISEGDLRQAAQKVQAVRGHAAHRQGEAAVKRPKLVKYLLAGSVLTLTGCYGGHIFPLPNMVNAEVRREQAAKDRLECHRSSFFGYKERAYYHDCMEARGYHEE